MSDAPKEQVSHDDDAGEIGSRGVPGGDMPHMGQENMKDVADDDDAEDDADTGADVAEREVEAGGAADSLG